MFIGSPDFHYLISVNIGFIVNDSSSLHSIVCVSVPSIKMDMFLS